MSRHVHNRSVGCDLGFPCPVPDARVATVPGGHELSSGHPPPMAPSRGSSFSFNPFGETAPLNRLLQFEQMGDVTPHAQVTCATANVHGDCPSVPGVGAVTVPLLRFVVAPLPTFVPPFFPLFVLGPVLPFLPPAQLVRMSAVRTVWHRAAGEQDNQIGSHKASWRTHNALHHNPRCLHLLRGKEACFPGSKVRQPSAGSGRAATVSIVAIAPHFPPTTPQGLALRRSRSVMENAHYVHCICRVPLLVVCTLIERDWDDGVGNGGYRRMVQEAQRRHSAELVLALQRSANGERG